MDCHLFYQWKKVLVGQKDTHAMKTRAILPEMHITGAAETADADAAVIPSWIIWSSKLLCGKIRKNHPGRVSVLAPVKKELLWYIFENHEQSIQVTMRMIRKYAEKNLPSLLQKNREANCQAIRRFLHRVGLTHQCATHFVQKSPPRQSQHLLNSWNS